MNICIHYGFGDYVVCYGLIKELAKYSSTQINLFAVQHRANIHIDNIKRLYSSIKNVRIVTDDPKNWNDVIYVGFDDFFRAVSKNPKIRNQEYFYKHCGVPLKLLWENFYFERNIEKEKEVYYDILGLTDNEEYIVLHDDPERDLCIKKEYIKSDVKVIHLIEHQNISILDTLFLIEKSKELHVINTGLVPFVDQMKIVHESLNYHQYVRPLYYEQPILKMKWNIIK